MVRTGVPGRSNTTRPACDLIGSGARHLRGIIVVAVRKIRDIQVFVVGVVVEGPVVHEVLSIPGAE